MSKVRVYPATEKRPEVVEIRMSRKQAELLRVLGHAHMSGVINAALGAGTEHKYTNISGLLEEAGIGRGDCDEIIQANGYPIFTDEGNSRVWA